MTKQNNELIVALVQIRCTNDPEANLARALAETRQASKQGAKIVCLPELFRTPYFCQTEDFGQFDLAEPIPGPTTREFSKMAKDRRVTVIVPVFERRAAGVYHNTAAVIGPDGKLMGVYRKMHIPNDPAYYEKFYFTPGDTGFKAWKLGDVERAGVERACEKAKAHKQKRTYARTHARMHEPRFGVLICWDQWFPEAARLTTLAGEEILFYPTAIGWHPHEKAELGKAQHEAWQTVQRGHAIANGVFVCAVNRTGKEMPCRDFSGGRGKGIEFWGQSFVADPLGRIIAQAGVDAEETLIVPLDLSQVESVRTHWPFLRDRRIDAYAGLGERFKSQD